MTNFFKKTLILILSSAMLLSMSVLVFGAETTSDYESHWASKTIESAIDLGIANGYPDGTFKPDDSITRGELFSLVNNAFEFTIKSEDTYTDVIADAWYALDISKAKAAGYIVGYPDRSIHPEMEISRQEVAVILSRLKSLPSTVETLDFTDASSIENWSKQSIIAMLEAKVMIGYPDGSFKPESKITRAEAVVALNNLLNYEELTSEANTEATTEATTETTTEPTTETTTEIEVVSVENLSVDQKAISLVVDGDTETIIATVTPENATNKDVNWTSSNTDVVTVNDGIITPVSVGTATITGVSVADESILATTEVTVNEADVTKVMPVDLGMAGDYVILAKTGISTVPNSDITGNIGVSPIDSTAITGFSLTVDASNQFSISSQLTGKAFAADYTTPTPSNLTTAVSNMETAYTDAAGRAADYTELHSGDLSGKTLTAGVYKWSTGVLINSDITLSGESDDVFIFQISEGITQANGTSIILTGGVQAKNIFWQTADTVSIGTGSHFEGNILSKTNITLDTNASINGRLLAQTAVTLDQATVVKP